MCEWKGVKIIEAECCPDHVHMQIEIPPKIAVSSFMGYLKGKRRAMLYEQYGELKYKCRRREFWCKGILCEYGMKEHEPNCGVYKEQAERR